MQRWTFNGGNRVCIHGASCVKYGCTYAHPSSRPKDCPAGLNCHRDTCKLHHPRSDKEVACRFGLHCTRPSCPFDHGGLPTPRFRRPCMHGAFCVKFGCIYVHPAGRKQDCTFGLMCKDSACPNLHPRPRKLTVKTSLPTSDFLVNQQVQAQYTPGASWRLATVCLVRPSCLTLQFKGWNDVSDVPLERVRHVSGLECKVDITSNFNSSVFPGAAVASPSPPKSSSPKSVMHKDQNQSDALKQLELLKQAAVAQEDFLLAADLKKKRDKVVELEDKKTAAVRVEDYLTAMNIQKQIAELIQLSIKVRIQNQIVWQPSAQTRTCREEASPREGGRFNLFCNQFTPLF